MSQCPCHSNKSYADCCEPYILGKVFPNSPEALMRSRYTAYTTANINYIADTMTGPAAQGFDPASAKQWAKKADWQGLEVLKEEQSTDTGRVEFIARYIMAGKPQSIHEISEFRKLNNRWYYYAGFTPKVGRNDPCPCSSGKKRKKCCIK